MTDYSNYLYVAIRAAVDAGRCVMDVYKGTDAGFEIEMKADHSPLTKADRAAHTLITGVLSATPFPILSEEGKDIPYSEREKWQTLWMVDPLDGTKEFIKRNGEFTVNIALIENHVPVLGVIYVPVRKDLYFGSDTHGAFKASGIDYMRQPSLEEVKEKSVRLPNAIAHQGVVVVASRSHITDETIKYIDNIRKQGQPVTTINSGSSLKICLVAEGTADVYPRFAPTMEWDTAAGHAIARAAGCEIYHVDEKTPLRYNKQILKNQWFIVKNISTFASHNKRVL